MARPVLINRYGFLVNVYSISFTYIARTCSITIAGGRIVAPRFRFEASSNAII